MSGLELLTAIKADETLKHIIVIILSGSGDQNDVAESYKLGAAGRNAAIAEVEEAFPQMTCFPLTISQRAESLNQQMAAAGTVTK